MCCNRLKASNLEDGALHNRPAADQLLHVARETLKSLLGELPASSHYQALMVLNAMATAAREMRNTKRDQDAELTDLERVYGANAAHADIDQLLRRLNARLAADLRAGRCNPLDDATVRHALWSQVRAKLAASNPKYLHAMDVDRPADDPINEIT